MSQDSKEGEGTEHPPTMVEWTARIVSVLIIGLMFGYLTFKALSAQHPPAFAFDMDDAGVRQVEDSWVAPVTVTNTGSSGVAQLVFDVEQGQQSRQVTVALIGPGEAKTVNVWVPARPEDEALRFTVRSYQ